jgi:hypothetical protein
MNIATLGSHLADLHLTTERELEEIRYHRERTASTFASFLTRLDTIRTEVNADLGQLRSDALEARDMIDADLAKRQAALVALIGSSDIDDLTPQMAMAAE